MIGIKEFKTRRQALCAHMLENSVAILPAAPVVQRNADVTYLYRQNSNFLYLSGFSEPEAVLVLLADGQKSHTILFCRDREPQLEQWTGERLGPKRVQEQLGIEVAYPIAEMDSRLPDILKGRSNLYYDLGENQTLDQTVLGCLKQLNLAVREGIAAPQQLITLKHLLDELRLHKSRAEIKIMSEAGQITALAHKRAMTSCHPGISESRIEAELNHEFAIHGARSTAYTSIVGGAERACILHYTDNNQELCSGDLVLIDAGCELEGYASDLTRTFPVNGRFSDAQKALYEVVLKAQLDTIACCKPGTLYNELQQTTDRVLTEGMLSLGLLKGNLEELIEKGSAKVFTVHKVGHWLGLDVHDAGSYMVDGQYRTLEPGMVTTVEPGVYIPPNSSHQEIPEEFLGIGIRIEDSVAITEGKPQILTEGVPKEISEIEHLMRS